MRLHVMLAADRVALWLLLVLLLAVRYDDLKSWFSSCGTSVGIPFFSFYLYDNVWEERKNINFAVQNTNSCMRVYKQKAAM